MAESRRSPFTACASRAASSLKSGRGVVSATARPSGFSVAVEKAEDRLESESDVDMGEV